MKKTTLTMIALIVICALAFTTSSCKKTHTQGCTSSSATNFNSSADEDDGSCKYSGNAVFWLDQTSSSDLQSYGISSIIIYVDGSVVGSTATSLYYSNAPSCGASGTMSVTKSLGGSKTKDFSYKITGTTPYTTDSILETGNITLTANTCTSFR